MACTLHVCKKMGSYQKLDPWQSALLQHCSSAFTVVWPFFLSKYLVHKFNFGHCSLRKFSKMQCLQIVFESWTHDELNSGKDDDDCWAKAVMTWVGRSVRALETLLRPICSNQRWDGPPPSTETWTLRSLRRYLESIQARYTLISFWLYLDSTHNTNIRDILEYYSDCTRKVPTTYLDIICGKDFLCRPILQYFF